MIKKVYHKVVAAGKKQEKGVIMSKFKIQKGLTDADMMKNFKEEETFENTMLRGEAETARKLAKAKKPTNDKEAFYREFLTEKLETQIGKLLLDIKMEYFKEGVGDFFIEVRKDGKNLVLHTGPKKVK